MPLSFSLSPNAESQSMDIERFSDMGKPKITSERDSLDQFLQLTSKNFPKELIGGLLSKFYSLFSVFPSLCNGVFNGI